MNWYGFWADVIVAIHVVYVGFVVGGELAVLGGLAFRQRWARNPWFRCIHLAAVLVVAFELLWGIECPFTTWEYKLRALAGQEPSGESFIGRCMHRLIFHPVDEWTITLIDAGVGLLVILTFAAFPPRFRKAKTAISNRGGPLTAPPLPG
jgi:hypothetical protein